jgi:hypothetical protein
MATLTEVSSVARKIIKFGFLALVILAISPAIMGVIKKVYKDLNPPAPVAPTGKYGKLPKLTFPEAPNFATPEYKLETISGSLPKFPYLGKVYLVGVNKSRLLILQRMTAKAKTIGLTIEPVQLNETTYRYFHPKLPIDMVFDVIVGGISYRYDWTIDRNTIYSTFNVLMDKAAANEGRNFLGKLGALPGDIANGETKITYLAATGSAMIPAPSLYEANFVRVDYFRAEKTENLPTGDKITMKTVTVGGDTAPVNVILSGLSGEKRVVQANYYYSQTLGDDFATYPLKPIDKAWEELTKGGGFIAKRTTQSNVTVRWVSLAYFESNEQQSFLQPVYVFEGDGGFLAYVQAVDQSYITSEAK